MLFCLPEWWPRSEGMHKLHSSLQLLTSKNFGFFVGTMGSSQKRNEFGELKKAINE